MWLRLSDECGRTWAERMDCCLPNCSRTEHSECASPLVQIIDLVSMLCSQCQAGNALMVERSDRIYCKQSTTGEWDAEQECRPMQSIAKVLHVRYSTRCGIVHVPLEEAEGMYVSMFRAVPIHFKRLEGIFPICKLHLRRHWNSGQQLQAWKRERTSKYIIKGTMSTKSKIVQCMRRVTGFRWWRALNEGLIWLRFQYVMTDVSTSIFQSLLRNVLNNSWTTPQL